MRIILTSRGFDSVRENDVKIDTNINESNKLLELININLKHRRKFVFISNDFTSYEDNDNSLYFTLLSFIKKDISFDEIILVDDREIRNIKDILEDASLIYFQGGRVDIQIDSLNKLNFKEYIKDSDALLIGQSAGSMIMGDIIYNYPETDMDIGGEKFLDGLNLTSIRIIPHFNELNGNELLDGHFNLLNDYYIPDSYKYRFYALKDGSHIVIANGKCIVYGECFLIENGIVKKICNNNQNYVIEG